MNERTVCSLACSCSYPETQNPNTRPGPQRRRSRTNQSHLKRARIHPPRKSQRPLDRRRANPGVHLPDEAGLDATNIPKTET